MKRPAGFTILSLLLGWLALAGLGNGIIQLKKSHGSIMMASLAFIYGITAFASALGLWKFKPWVYQAVLSWSVTVFLLMLSMQFNMYGVYAVPIYMFAAFALFIIGLLALLLNYVKKHVPKADS